MKTVLQSCVNLVKKIVTLKNSTLESFRKKKMLFHWAFTVSWCFWSVNIKLIDSLNVIYWGIKTWENRFILKHLFHKLSEAKCDYISLKIPYVHRTIACLKLENYLLYLPVQLNYSGCYFLSSTVHSYSLTIIQHQNKTKSSHTVELHGNKGKEEALQCLQTWLKEVGCECVEKEGNRLR